MANTRMTIIMRKGLLLPEGLAMSQAAHMNDAFMRRKIVKGDAFTPEEVEWMKTPYLYIFKVQTYEELLYLHDQAKKDCGDDIIHLWKDVLFHPELGVALPTTVGFSIGPCDADKVKLVTGTLSLY